MSILFIKFAISLVCTLTIFRIIIQTAFNLSADLNTKQAGPLGPCITLRSSPAPDTNSR